MENNKSSKRFPTFRYISHKINDWSQKGFTFWIGFIFIALAWLVWVYQFILLVRVFHHEEPYFLFAHMLGRFYVFPIFLILGIIFIMTFWIRRLKFISILKNILLGIFIVLIALPLILFLLYGFYLTGSSILYAPGDCGRASGNVEIDFRDTASVSEVIEFVDEVLFKEYGFSEADMRSPNFGSMQYQWLLREDSYYLGAEFILKDERLKYGTIRNDLANLAKKLSRDERIERVYHDNYSYRIYAVEFREEISFEEFLNDYPQLVLFPKHIDITQNRAIEGIDITPKTMFFIYHTLADELAFVQSLENQLSSLNPEDHIGVSYDDYGFFFTVVFPSHYSYVDIGNIAQELLHITTIEYDPPLKISQSVRVPEGSERRWAKEFRQYGAIVDYAVRTHLMCPPTLF